MKQRPCNVYRRKKGDLKNKDIFKFPAKKAQEFHAIGCVASYQHVTV